MLGFIIFGWPKREKEYGECTVMDCPRCNNRTYWHLLKQRRWFSLFFIPILPLGFADKYLFCEICACSYELDSREDYKDAKELVGLTQQYADEELTEEKYITAVEAFNAGRNPREAIEEENAIEIESKQKAENPTDD